MPLITAATLRNIISVTAAACVMLVAGARAGIVAIDPNSSVSYDGADGEVVGDYFGTFQGIVPAGGGDTFDQTFDVPGPGDNVSVSLFSYVEDPEPLPIFDATLGLGSGVIVEGTNGGGNNHQYSTNLVTASDHQLRENVAWSLNGDSVAGGGNWSGIWSVTWTETGPDVPTAEFAPAPIIELDAPPNAPGNSPFELGAQAAPIPDASSSAILFVAALAGLGFCARKAQRARGLA